MKKILLALIALSALCSCTVTEPVCATSNPIGSKRGTSTARRILGIWVQQDASVITAARNGGITRISTVDKKVRRGIFVYKVETIVTGELK